MAEGRFVLPAGASLPRGIPAASLKLQAHEGGRRAVSGWSSAGNTRGLIEAALWTMSMERSGRCLPRGIPAASLKPHARCLIQILNHGQGLPRGIPAASLKPDLMEVELRLHKIASSAGNTRGLIEAACVCAPCPPARSGLPRGIPAASLKRRIEIRLVAGLALRLPRGIPAASLKPSGDLDCLSGHR